MQIIGYQIIGEMVRITAVLIGSSEEIIYEIPFEEAQGMLPELNPSQEEIDKAQLLINQIDIINRQQEQDEAMAAILLLLAEKSS